ncbi:MAG: NAD-dependent epimerase/dehydratase family protein [Nitrospirota bacterium]
MKVLVTGGAGFIGSHLTDRLIKEGHTVVVLDNLLSGKKKNINKEAIFYKADILNASRLERIFTKEKPRLICHYAAQIDVRKSVDDPVFDVTANVIGLLNVLQTAVKNGGQKVIFASSGGAAYGEQSVFPATEEHETHPLSPYGISKLASEHYLYYYQKVRGLESAVLRFANVYGPRQDSHGEAGVVAIFAKKLIDGVQTIINGNGMQTRDYVYVDDVVDANMAVINGSLHDTFNVGTGKETSVNDLFSALLKETQTKVTAFHGMEKKGEQRRSCISSEKLHKATGWEARTSLAEGLARTVQHIKGK